MLRGLYSAASGMLASLVEADTITNNLANVNTPGYQPDTVIYRSFPKELYSRINDVISQSTSAAESRGRPVVGEAGTGVIVEGVFTTFRQGKMEHSNNPFDLGLEGDGFFAVDTPDGTRYTRNGSFTLNNEGILTTLQGYPVLGQRFFDEPLSPIKIPQGELIEIDEEGKIWADKEIINQLAIRDFPKPYQLSKIGEDLLEVSGEGERGRNFKVAQGWLEKPDVSVVKEMVSLIKAFRTYEANSKAVSANDQMLAKSVNEVGRYVG